MNYKEEKMSNKTSGAKGRRLEDGTTIHLGPQLCCKVRDSELTYGQTPSTTMREHIPVGTISPWVFFLSLERSL